MSEVTAEMLSAYHDRELGLEETSRLRRSLAADAEARATLDAFDWIDDAVRESFAEDLDAPISLNLARAVRSGLAARRRRAIGRTVLRWAGPVAAAIAVVVFGNNWVEQRTELALAERELQIAELTDRAVQDALENALSGAAMSLADDDLSGVVSITPTRTYRSETKHWCREFVEDVVIDGKHTTRFGLACRENSGEWRRVQTRLPGSTPPPVGTVL
jgi:surface antigen